MFAYAEFPRFTTRVWSSFCVTRSRLTRQVVKGVGEIGGACLSIALTCAFPPESTQAAVVVPLAVTNATSDFVAGTVNIYAGATGQTAIGEKTQQTLEAYGTPVAAVATLASGNPQTGKNVNTAVNALTSIGDLGAGGSTLETLKDLDAAGNVVQGANAVQNLLSSQPPNGAGGTPCPRSPNSP
jgi:hypothetical protein